MVPNKLNFIQFSSYKNPLTLEDLSQALSYMANNKVPRLDDFPYEFYKTFWDFLDLHLLHVYQEAIQAYSIDFIINKSNIIFIPKVGDLELITN